MEQAPSRGHEAIPQSGLSVSCRRCPSSKKLRGLGVRAQARRIRISLSFSVVGVSSFLSPPRSAMRRGAWKTLKQGLGMGGALSLVLVVKALQKKCTVHITNRDMHPAYVQAMHFCNAPLWG